MEAQGNVWQRHDLAAQPSGAPEAEPQAARHPSGTFFGEGCEASGTLAVENAIELAGEFEGSIVGKDSVTIAPGAAVQADIRARTVVILGAVVGNVEGSREVVLGPTARLHGDIETPSLVIERGAFVVGGTRMRAPLPARRSLEEAANPAPPRPPAVHA